jgi:hypothetical protein
MKMYAYFYHKLRKVLVILLVSYLASACNNGHNSTDSATVTPQKNPLSGNMQTPLGQFFNKLDYTSLPTYTSASNLTFNVPNPVTLSRMIVAWYNDDNCANKVANDPYGGPVSLPAGSYTINQIANNILSDNYTSLTGYGHLGLRTDQIKSKKYFVFTSAKRPFISSCISQATNTPPPCANGVHCGKSSLSLKITNINQKGLIFISPELTTGNLLQTAINDGCLSAAESACNFYGGTVCTTGLEAANYICNAHKNSGELPWEAFVALIESNQATTPGYSYYNIQDEMLITATGSFLMAYESMGNAPAGGYPLGGNITPLCTGCGDATYYLLTGAVPYETYNFLQWGTTNLPNAYSAYESTMMAQLMAECAANGIESGSCNSSNSTANQIAETIGAVAFACATPNANWTSYNLWSNSGITTSNLGAAVGFSTVVPSEYLQKVYPNFANSWWGTAGPYTASWLLTSATLPNSPCNEAIYHLYCTTYSGN